jgi:hypothetical protein
MQHKKDDRAELEKEGAGVALSHRAREHDGSCVNALQQQTEITQAIFIIQFAKRTFIIRPRQNDRHTQVISKKELALLCL